MPFGRMGESNINFGADDTIVGGKKHNQATSEQPAENESNVFSPENWPFEEGEQGRIIIVPEILDRTLSKIVREQGSSGSFTAYGWYYALRSGDGRKLFPEYTWDTDYSSLATHLKTNDEAELDNWLHHLISNFSTMLAIEIEDCNRRLPRYKKENEYTSMEKLASASYDLYLDVEGGSILLDKESRQRFKQDLDRYLTLRSEVNG